MSISLWRHPRYWWGVAGERSMIYVEDWEGRVGVLQQPGQLDALMDALDVRGQREHCLQASCDKVHPCIAACGT